MELTWDKVGERVFEAGVSKGVLYLPNSQGNYLNGYAWNGLVSVTESPSGAESNKQYANNRVYVNLTSAEEFGGTIEAFTYPDEFAQCNGEVSPTPGLSLGQQGRKSFGLAYKTQIGNDIDGTNFGYKLHLIYGATAAPTERAYTTINDSPEAATFSWEISTTAIDVPGYAPTSSLTIDSTKVDADTLKDLEDMLYGTAGTDPMMPSPADVIAMFAGTVALTTPVAPTYNSTTKVITIPATTGVLYQIDGVTKPSGPTAPITKNTLVTSKPAQGYKFPSDVDVDWGFSFA